MRWQDKLTKTDLRHLRTNGVRTLKRFKQVREHQLRCEREAWEKHAFKLISCWECRMIAKKLGME